VIGVLDQQRDRRSGRLPVHHAPQDLRPVVFELHPRAGAAVRTAAQPSVLPADQVRLQILRLKRQTRRDAFEDRGQRRTV
jgi:hypothetical protein